MRLSVTHDKKQRDAYAQGNTVAQSVHAVLAYALRTSFPIPQHRLGMRLSITHDKKQQDDYAPQGMPLYPGGCQCTMACSHHVYGDLSHKP